VVENESVSNVKGGVFDELVVVVVEIKSFI